MKKIGLLFILASLFLSGCFSGKFDFNDPNSVEKMLKGKTESEKIEFFKKTGILLENIKAIPPESGLQGMTYDEIISKADVVIEEVNKYNIDALRGMAVKASVSNNNQASYMVRRGRYVMPQPGYHFKTLSYNEILSELAKLEGGVVSEESNLLIANSSKEIINKRILEIAKSSPPKPMNIDAERYSDLIHIMREVAARSESFNNECVDAYIFNATTYGGHSKEEAKSIGAGFCKEQLDSARQCLLKDNRRIINCLHEAVPEPS